MKKLMVVALSLGWLALGGGALLAQTQEEYDELLKITREPSVDARIKSGETFLEKYPKSPYVVNVRQQLAYAYNTKGNTGKVIEHGGQVESVKDPFLQTFLANAYGERKNDAKTLAAAQEALELLASGAKPENVPDNKWAAQKTTLLSTNQYLIGTAYSRQAQQKSGEEKMALLSKSRQALLAAVKLNPRYDVAHYQLGLTLSDMGEGDDACDALAKAVVLGGPAGLVARHDLERIYEHYNRSKLGLDKVLAKAKAELKIK
ncbi:MAG: hypothetical protein HYX74_07940 [Acidobacteria bacterium]|nr:hypothetical protein [Acidobacteriota bacterium]